MIMTYNGMMMTSALSAVNRVRDYRSASGMTQAELAQRAGISRTAVTAIEGNRLIPSVAAALSLASALGTTVEALFGQHETEAQAATWAWEPVRGTQHFWEAEVAGRHWLYPADSSPMFTPLPDASLGQLQRARTALANETLVIACCDPAAGYLASRYSQATSLRMLVVSRSSGESLELLRQGKVHIAGVHLSTNESPQDNAKLVRERLGDGFQLLRVASWQEGIAITPSAKIRSVRSALQAKLTWVGREPGSGARRCLDRLLANRNSPRRLAHHHRGVAEAVKCGWADAGVCVQLASTEAGLDFLPVQEEAYDICIPRTLIADPRVKALIQVIRSVTYRKLLTRLPGYDVAETGNLSEVN
jgi:molybdate-binding protein/DNA-binding XRE family transcriptional regulator